MAIPFLTARWSNLCLLSYAVPAALLQPRVPRGLEFDTHPHWSAGTAFVSLVAFDFLQTRVLGVPWPGFRNFAEINLRYYVRRRESPAERGVVFVREFVPQRLVAWLARAVYNEPYRAAPVASTVTEEDTCGGGGDAGRVIVEHRLTWAGRVNMLRVIGRKPAARPGEESLEYFFKEHRWGFGADRRGRCIRYEVEHPAWEVYPVKSYAVDFDWASVYGAEWGFLREAEPMSVILAVGSGVKVFPLGAA